MKDIQSLLPQDKFDNANIAALSRLCDEEIQPIAYKLLEWLQDYNWPIAAEILPIIASHQNVFMPHIITVLQGDDVIWKYWIMEKVIPLLSDEHRQLLQSEFLRLAVQKETDEDIAAVAEAAQSCLTGINRKLRRQTMFESLIEQYGDDFNWYIPSEMSAFERELQNELVSSHPLFGKRLTAVAKSAANDDVLFCDDTHYYIVHLTWMQGNDRHPVFQEFDSLSEALDAIERSFKE